MDMKRFNERMSKRQKLSKGGMIKKIAGRHYFDDGGSTTLGGPTSSNNGNGGNTVNNNGLVGTVGNELGLNNEFQAQSANIQNGTNVGQLNAAYQGAQNGLNQQQTLAGQVAPGTQQGLNTQNALTGQLEGVVNGTGPNAAQAALNQNTSTNVANQAALMAGQRGSAANPGLIAREAAQQGAATQQQAVGQGATLQAQQAIAAQQQLAGLAQTQVGQGAQAIQGVNNAQQNEQNILQGANTSANNANVAMQSNINNVNAGVSAANQQQAGNIVNGIGGALSNVPVIGSLFEKGGEVSDHHCAGPKCTDRAHYAHMMADGGSLQVTGSPAQVGVGPWLNSNTSAAAPNVSSAPIAQPNVGNPFAFLDKKKSPGSSAPSVPGPSGGTPITGMDTGAGSAAQASQDATMPIDAGAGSNISDILSAVGPAAELAQANGGMIDWHEHFSGGGAVPAMVSAKERYLNPEEVRKVVQEGADPLKLGTVFKGKAKVKGDSLKNDTIKTSLQEGGVVIPRHITTMKSPHKSDKAALFVHKAVHMKAPKAGAK